jgi:tRNA (guanine-N7-)-methyltransferase
MSDDYDVRNTFLRDANPLAVDVGSGKGRFLLARAEAHPQTNFLGIERQYGRICKTAAKVRRAELENVRLARVEAAAGIAELLQPESVSIFYIFFPDPWPKRRHHRRRLINPDFLTLLHSRLERGGVVHFASDHEDYAVEVAKLFRKDERFDEIDPFVPSEDERTDFEIVFTGKPIGRVSIRKC